jgi:hypothetical protein
MLVATGQRNLGLILYQLIYQSSLSALLSSTKAASEASSFVPSGEAAPIPVRLEIWDSS